MQRLLFFCSALTVLALLAIWPTSAQGTSGYQIVIHAENPASALEKGQVSNFLLKKKSRWSDGTPVDPVDLPSDSPVRAALSEDVHGRSVSSIKNYWQRQIFSGRNVPPPELDDDAAVIDYVRSNPGAIGYVSQSTGTSGVKVLQVTE